MTGQTPRTGPFLRSFPLLSLVLLFSSVALGANEKPRSHLPASSEQDRLQDDDTLERQLRAYVGIPYRRGGACLKGMDCSGFSSFVYSKMFGVDLPHNAASQYKLSFLEPVTPENLQPGDLLFFSRRKRVDHVGIYLGDGRFIHASGKKRKITISSLESPHFQRTFVGARRVADAFQTGQDGDIEAGFEFAFEERDRIRFLVGGSNRLSTDEFGGFAEPIFFSGLPDGEGGTWPFFFEVEYRHVLLDHAWNVTLSALWERSYLNSETHPLFTLRQSPKPTFFSEDPHSISRSGFRMASDVGILPWLRLTPSVTYYEYGDDFPSVAAFPGVLGLEAKFLPPSARYGLAMALRYGDNASAFLGRHDLVDSSRALGLSFAFRYRLTDLFHVSLLGHHSISETLPASSQDPRLPSVRTYHDLFFTFDLSY